MKEYPDRKVFYYKNANEEVIYSLIFCLSKSPINYVIIEADEIECSTFSDSPYEIPKELYGTANEFG